MLPKAHITFDDCCADNDCDCNWMQCITSVGSNDDFNNWLYLTPMINKWWWQKR